MSADTTGIISPHCLAPTKWVCFEPTVWSDTCCSVHRIRCRCSVARSMDTHVRLNVATRVCDVYPDKYWFALLRRFWLQCSRTLRRRSAAALLLRLWVRIPQGEHGRVCCECYVLSGRDLCDELITRPEENYRVWCVVVCDQETSWIRRPWPTGGGGLLRPPPQKKVTRNKYIANWRRISIIFNKTLFL